MSDGGYKGKINQYTCDTCGGVITTVDRHEGTTPMRLDCWFTLNCPGMMRSSMYGVDQGLTPDYEWVKPLGKMRGDPVMQQYVAMGGLLIRRIEGQEKVVSEISPTPREGIESPFFQGEMMLCALCGKQEPSDPKVSKQWRIIQLDDVAHYVCPRHFPPDHAKASDFRHAYKYVMQKLMARKVN